MRIALVVTDLSNTRIGGISRVATELGRNLVALGHEVVAYLLRRPEAESPSQLDGMQLRYIEPFRTINADYPVVGFSRRAFARLLDDLERESFDVLQSFNLNSIALTQHHRQLAERKVATVLACYETIGMDVWAKWQEFRSSPSLRTLAQIAGESYLMGFHERRYLRLADAIVTEDENTRAALAKMGIDTARVHLAPSGVDVAAAVAANPPEVPTPWREGGPVIGYIGRVDPRKGVQYLLDAVARVRATFPRVQLVLVGGSRHGYDDTIRSVIARHGLEQHVHVLGRVPGEILPYYKLMDLIVIPSLSEGIPITLGEAMASRVPVVITRLPGVVPFVQPADLVHWADIASPASLVEAITTSLQQSDREGQIERAFAFIKQYTWRAVAERHAEVYRTVLRSGSPAPPLVSR
ncbi:MAG: glycosyltransferase family 1 protein [Planctomycetota bacterium]|nr:MAG: glycosyltransferase family 1 protein [Planctomycetota bacterium]